MTIEPLTKREVKYLRVPLWGKLLYACTLANTMSLWYLLPDYNLNSRDCHSPIQHDFRATEEPQLNPDTIEVSDEKGNTSCYVSKPKSLERTVRQEEGQWY